MSTKYEDTLRAVGIFSSLTDDQIAQISQLLTQKRYPKGAVIYEQGDFFGEMALLSGQTRSATIIAVTDCRVLVLRKDAFETFLSTNLQVMRQMLKVISERQADYNLL